MGTILDDPARRDRRPGNLGAADERHPALKDQGAGLQGLARRSDFDRFHERTRTHQPDFIYEIVRIVMSLIAWVFFACGRRTRRTCPRSARHPGAEPLLVPGPLLPRRGPAAQGPLHGQVAALQAADAVVYTHGGVFPVRRGFADEEAFTTAVAILDRGDTMAMYAEGGRSRTGELSAEAAARDRSPGAAERGADRPGGDRRLLATCATGSGCSSRRSASTTGSRSASSASRSRRARRSRPRPTPSSPRSRKLYDGQRPARAAERSGGLGGRRCARLAGISRAISAPTASTAAPTQSAPHAVGEGLRRRVGAVGREDRGEHGDAEDAADLADRVGRARGLAGLLRADRGEHGVGRRREHERHADAGEDERDDELGVGDVGVETAASQPSAIACSASPATISGRAPMRSVSRPAIGATSIGIAVHGSVRRPASSGERPCAVWKNWASRKIEPNMPKNIANETPLVAAKARERKKRIGSIGAGARSSQATKRGERAAPASSATITVRARPAELRAADDAEDDAEQAERRRAPRPRRSSRPAGP